MSEGGGKAVVRVDEISWLALVLAVAILIYSATFGAELMLKGVFLVVMAFAGLYLNRLVGRGGYDPSISRVEGNQIIWWFAISFGTIFLLNRLVTAVPSFLSVDTVTIGAPLTRGLFGVLVAVAEESYFRGFFASYFGARLGIIGGSFASGVVFGIYHLAVYGSSFGFMFIAIFAGIILSYTALRTGRLSITMLTHALNNFIAMGGFG